MWSGASPTILPYLKGRDHLIAHYEPEGRTQNMLTVQEIQAMSFEKAVFGGYDMKSVDEFVEQMTEDYAALQKENAALKSKMKVLVDKIEEYRSVEDGMRRALVSAQNIAQETIDKAKLEAEETMSRTKAEQEQMLTRMRTEYEAKTAIYEKQIAAEEMRLKQAKQGCTDFLTKLTAYYEEQLKGLVALSASEALKVEDVSAASAVQPTTPETPETLEVTRDLSRDVTTEPKSEAKEYTIPEDIRKFMDQQQGDDGMKVKMMEVTMRDSQAEAEGSKSKFSFGELKFGSDYSPENDR